VDTVSRLDRRADLVHKLDATLDTMRRAASAAVIKGDPLADQLSALALSIEALGEICDANAETRHEIENRLRTEAALVADRAIERVHAADIGIIEQLTPRLAALVERTSRRRLMMWRCRSIVGTAAVALLALSVSAGYVYAIGYTAGRTNGELIGHTISAAMAAGPVAAMDWASLMALNDPRQALASCRSVIQRDGHGRRYCAMPVWIDPPAAARPAS
jgi:hypothetical protein